MSTVTDDFTRADAASLGANWSQMKGMTGGDIGIFSNQADITVANDRCGNYYSAASSPTDQFSQATVVTRASAWHAVVVRAITSGSTRYHYAGGHFNNDFGDFRYRIWKEINSGVAVSLGAHATVDVAGGDVLRLDVTGSTLSLKKNGVEQVAATDGTLASGQPGIYATHSAVNVALFDDWSGEITPGGVEDATGLIYLGAPVLYTDDLGYVAAAYMESASAAYGQTANLALLRPSAGTLVKVSLVSIPHVASASGPPHWVAVEGQRTAMVILSGR